MFLSSGALGYALRDYFGLGEDGGPKKTKSSNDDEHGHGQEKRGPSTYVDGKTALV